MKNIAKVLVFGLTITAFAGSLSFAGENPPSKPCTAPSNIGQADAPKSAQDANNTQPDKQKPVQGAVNNN